MTRRRTFLSVLGVLAAQGPVFAQPTRKVHRIGVLGIGPTTDLAGPTPASPTLRAFIAGLRELGYLYGQQYVIEARGADAKPERFPALAADLVGRDVDVIVAPGQ